MNGLRPADIIALITIIGCFVMIFFSKGEPLMIYTLLTTVIGFYFGRVTAKSELPREPNGRGL